MRRRGGACYLSGRSHRRVLTSSHDGTRGIPPVRCQMMPISRRQYSTPFGGDAGVCAPRWDGPAQESPVSSTSWGRPSEAHGLSQQLHIHTSFTFETQLAGRAISMCLVPTHSGSVAGPCCLLTLAARWTLLGWPQLRLEKRGWFKIRADRQPRRQLLLTGAV